MSAEALPSPREYGPGALDLPEGQRALGTDSIAAVREHVVAAKARGWVQADLSRFFRTKGLDLQTYLAAMRGEPVPEGAAGDLLALSIVGLPDTPHAPNEASIRAHLEWLAGPARGDFDDALVEIAYTPRGEAGISQAKLFGLDELETAARFAVAMNAERRNVYVGAALRLPDTPKNKRASAEHFYVATAVPIDIDHDYDAVRASHAAVCDDGLVVTTGMTPERRSQHWARLVEPCDDDLEFGHAFEALVHHVGADPKVTDAARIMRLGGTVSFPLDAKKLAAGYCTELTTVQVNPDARPVSVERLKALEPSLVPSARFDASGRPANTDIERDWTGRVTDGREAHWRDRLLYHLRSFQEQYGLDPVEDDLWDLAWPEFSDSTRVENADGRWTSPAGQKQLRQRLQNTLNRLRLGHLARFGAYSIDTGVNKDQAEEVAARRRPTSAAADAHVEAVVSQDGVPAPSPIPAADARTGGQPVFDPWERYLTPAFPLNCLPPVMRRFVEVHAESTGADVSAIAMAALATCSGAIDHRFELKMKRSGTWHVTPRLWVMLIGSSSAKKTPAINGCVAPLKRHDTALTKAHHAALARWEAEVEAKLALKTDKPASPTRFIVNDTTSEKLGEVLSRQERGLLVEQDELAGWLGTMEKYSGGGKGSAADRGFWLQAYNGGPKRIDRLSRGELFIENCSVSLLGGIQPARLDEMGNLSTDGLLQRFLPVLMRKPDRPAEVDDGPAAAAYTQLINHLVEAQPCKVLMDEAALAVANEFQDFVFDTEHVEGLGESFCAFMGKLSGVHGSLMLNLFLADNPDNVYAAPVGRDVAERAMRILRDFAIPHALALYRQSTDKVDWDYLRTVASFILTSTKDRFTVSDFTSNVKPLRGLSVWDVGQKVSPLVAGGWLVEEDPTAPAKAWRVVFGLRERLAERRATELVSKEATLQRLKLLRGANA